MTSFREVLEKMLVIVVLPVRKSLRKEMELFSPHLVSNTCGLLASIVSELTASALGSEVRNTYLSHPPLSLSFCPALLFSPLSFFVHLHSPFSSPETHEHAPSVCRDPSSASLLVSYYSSLMVINSLWQFWRDDKFLFITFTLCPHFSSRLLDVVES